MCVFGYLFHVPAVRVFGVYASRVRSVRARVEPCQVVAGSTPVERALLLHRGGLAQSSDPAQHVLLGVRAEVVRAHALVHHLAPGTATTALFITGAPICSSVKLSYLVFIRALYYFVFVIKMYVLKSLFKTYLFRFLN